MRILGCGCVLVVILFVPHIWAWSPSYSILHAQRVSGSEMTRKKQRRPSTRSFSSATSSTTSSMPSYKERLSQWKIPTNLPKLLVFDLDNTLWTPELYQIKRSRKQVPIANKDIRLFEGVLELLQLLSSRDEFQGVQLAVASRTNKGDWARELLQNFVVHGDMNTNLQDILDHVEIYTGSKRRHFEALKEQANMKFSDMVFFDDDVHLNLNEVSAMGVFCSHCPHGLTVDLFMSTLDKYDELLLQHSSGHWMGHIVNSQKLGLATATALDEGRKTTGVVTFYNPAKRFGFVRELNKTDKEFFFHESKVAEGVMVEKGMRVEFETLVDGKGRPAAAVLSSKDEDGSSNDQNLVSMPCFTMSQPFVALLLNGIKTVETRNNDMFRDVTPGTRVLLHCGRRDWKDLEAPKIALRQAGYSDHDIDKLAKLPKNLAKGSIVGILTVGRTWESNPQERQSSDLQRQVVANEHDMGKICTAISNAQWLDRPVRTRGNPGVYKVPFPKDRLPSPGSND